MPAAVYFIKLGMLQSAFNRCQDNVFVLLIKAFIKRSKYFAALVFVAIAKSATGRYLV